jgi:hypothetical protein
VLASFASFNLEEFIKFQNFPRTARPSLAAFVKDGIARMENAFNRPAFRRLIHVFAARSFALGANGDHRIRGIVEIVLLDFFHNDFFGRLWL